MVTLRIYDTAGRIVRTLDLGFKPQGFYMTRAEAAYWDGRNRFGESVGGGVYFYDLSAGEYSSNTGKIVIH